jgi:hypothetical protein
MFIAGYSYNKEISASPLTPLQAENAVKNLLMAPDTGLRGECADGRFRLVHGGFLGTAISGTIAPIIGGSRITLQRHTGISSILAFFVASSLWILVLPHWRPEGLPIQKVWELAMMSSVICYTGTMALLGRRQHRDMVQLRELLKCAPK